MNEKELKCRDILGKLKSMGKTEAVEGMAQYGINPRNNYGVSIHNLREIAKEVGRDHELALQLWVSGIHDAKILASIIDDPGTVTEEQMDTWANEFDSWDVCDQTCNNLFSKTLFAYAKAEEWSKRSQEFIKRAGFVLMASLSVHDKSADNSRFLMFLSLVENDAQDERKYVRKAVNWALRQIGKRNPELNKAAVDTAKRILKLDSKYSKWIARDAIRELTDRRIMRKVQF